MYLWWSLFILYLLTCQVRVSIGNSCRCCVCDVFPAPVKSLGCWFCMGLMGLVLRLTCKCMYIFVCLYVEPVLRSKDNVWFWTEIGSSGGVYVPYVYLMPDESYHRQLRSLLLCLCKIFLVLINSFVYWTAWLAWAGWNSDTYMICTGTEAFVASSHSVTSYTWLSSASR